MKILFLTRRYYPEIGGVEKHVQKISEELVKLGHTITIITELHQGKNKNFYQSLSKTAKQSYKSKQGVKSSYFEYFQHKNIRVIYFDAGRSDWYKKFRIWRWFVLNIGLIKDFDVIHCHDVFFWCFPLKVILPRKKIFTTFHGYESYPVDKKNILIRKISELLSAGTICVGEFMKKWYFANPDFVIYGGMDIPKKMKRVQKPKAIFYGRLDEQTNILEYIKATSEIKKYMPKFQLNVYGEGKYASEAKKNADLNTFINNTEKVIQDYRYAFISRYLSILEALAAKKTVFAYYADPLKRDYLALTPFKNYINIVNNPFDLASLVQFYYSNNKIEQSRVEKGYEWAKKQSWAKIAYIYLRLWRK